jgi:CRP-like cAMP-binding protein
LSLEPAPCISRRAIGSRPKNDLAKVELSADGVLLRKAEPAQYLYVVASGRLRANVPGEDGGQLTLSEFGPGEMAGEEVYGATVSNLTHAVLVRVPREPFEAIVKRAPEAVREMSEGIHRHAIVEGG